MILPRKLFLLLIFLGVVVIGSAQDFLLNITVGWRIGGEFGTGYFVDDNFGKDEFVLENNPNFSLTANIPIYENAELEFFIDHQNTRIHSRSGSYLAPFSSLNIYNNYYHGGMIWVSSYMGTDFYTGATLGVTHLIPQDDFDSKFYFSFGGTAGFRFFFAENFGVNVHSRVLFTSINGRDGIFEKNGVPQFYFDGTFLIQVDFSIGLIIAI